jgi:branched-chain amino acid transport system ATP-binding protein
MSAEPEATGSGAAALSLAGVTAGYGRTTVLREIDLDVRPGSVAALLGPNGAGKTTLLRVASGLLPARSGTVHVCGTDLTSAEPHVRARAGLCLIPEGRGIFRTLTVRENLQLQMPHASRRDEPEAALEAFPILRDRLDQVAGTLSGGQQQMLALARCYLSSPAVVLLDEISMGLAPRVIDEMYAALMRLCSTGVALLLVEQYVSRVLQMADVVHILNRGRITHTAAPSSLDEDAVVNSYLGDIDDVDEPTS